MDSIPKKSLPSIFNSVAKLYHGQKPTPIVAANVGFVLGTELNLHFKLLNPFTSVGTQLCLRLLCVLILIKLREQITEQARCGSIFLSPPAAPPDGPNGAAVSA